MKSLTVIICFVLIFMGAIGNAWGQSKKQYTRKGNKEYQNKNYADAEVSYRKALAQDSTYSKADFNLGNSLYKQDHLKEANLYYQKLLSNPDLDKNLRAETYYNLGNSYLKQGLESSDGNPMESFQNAVNAYKSSLRINPNDKDTKYNLAYAQKYLQQEQQKQQQQQNKQDDQQKDKQEQKQNNNDNKQNKEQQQQQEKQKEMKKSDAERVLNALNDNEKKTLEKLKQKEKAKSGSIEKDW